ncbi:PREDICTED: serine/threonine-protein kinase Nek11 [Merops nubicus]|uniref:serine/threonine-protein kinase Nek11 n=1 Tax=Merops nubicus TaxID=57421 RepID=UPI0004F04177|nr:PREDICTED: serine/threonine-protein kinase Nek11 [Merops nubicus]
MASGPFNPGQSVILKVLKEISVGDLKPNETVEANLEAQLLSKLDHPAIVKFYASFVERESFCIVTEYCEGGDLDFKIQEYKKSGKIFTQRQIIDWFIQLLLGVNYMHERWILHRDLKAKNIFLKNNLLKIGDFGISRLLMGSCDLATTFAGTPHYMSPEALKHQGYNTKSDIWSLGCILYEMCCMNHAFTGHNFLSVVLKIVEGDTPSLPDRYPSKLNAVLCSMLNKNPSLRPAAAEILKMPYIDEQLKNIQYKFTNMVVKDKALAGQKGAAPIFDAVQRRVHLQTLQGLSEVQKMTPRERMRLRKLNAADEGAKKLKQLAEEKYQENIKRMQELRARNVGQLHADGLGESEEQTSKPQIHSQPVTACNCVSVGHGEPSGRETSQLCMSELTDHEIPEDPETAEEYYNDEFESYSEGSEAEEDVEASQTVSETNHQDSDIEAMVKCLESVLNNSSLGSGTVTRVSPGAPPGLRALNSTMAEAKLKHMRESAVGKLGVEVFEAVYSSLKQARQQDASEEEIRTRLEKLVSRASDCFEVDQLLYFEEQLQASEPRLQP